MKWLGKLFFGQYDRAIRRKYLRFLAVALLLALLVCLAVGGLLYLLYQRALF